MPRTRPAARWTVPAGIAAVAVAATVVAPAIAAAEPDLPDVTAAELLADLRTAPVDGLSGTVVHRADLGLPALPGLTDGGSGRPGGGAADAMALLDGEHTLRVWAAAPDRARVSLHGGMSELTAVTDGDELWVWRSEGSTATQVLLPEPGEHGTDVGLAGKAHAGLPPMTPAELADLALDALDPTTDVTVGAPVRVAGRAAYELVLDPRTDGTLVEEVRIAVDAADRVPTRVQLYAVGHPAPALDVGFTALSLTAPDDDVFAFTPPPGATVEVLDVTEASGHTRPGGAGTADDEAGADADRTARGEPTVVGDGWSAVLVAALPPGALARFTTPEAADAEPADRTGPMGPHGRDRSGPVDAAALLGALPEVSGGWGTGRLVESRLVSALITDDGRVLVGAVDGDALQEAAETVGSVG